ncbi:GTPase subunit of restriction endonuclease [Clostridioides difficile]|nr:GTPase subunit of restriction endonuclease [Clostridioides difficile]
MRITYIAWKKVINSDVNRLIYGTQGDGLHNKGDQAIQNFNTLNENPGLWGGFTGGSVIPRKKEVEANNRANNTNFPTTYDVELSNSVNPLKLWEDKNDTRHNPVKINHEIWDRSSGHHKAIIEPWYLGYMRLLRKLLQKLVARDGEGSVDVNKLLSFVDNRLKQDVEIRANILKWIYDTQDGFASLYLDTSFMSNANIKDINGFIEQNFYLVVKCEENGREHNMALMANSASLQLHPTIRQLLLSNEKGGEYVDIDVSLAASSPDSQRFLDALNNYKNIILYGPPGTGKTHMLTELMQSFNANVLFDDLDTEAPFKVTGNCASSSVKWCTFHPNYSYESFVNGIMPEVVDKELAFKPYVGPLLAQAIAASKGTKSLLVIDEINRAKADDVFGASMAVLERGSNELVRFTHSFEYDGKKIEGIQASDNMFIVGTMNSLDKSTAPLSAELKRRFIIIEILPNVEVLRSHLQRNKTIDEKLITFCCDLMMNLNQKIHEYCGKEFELGQGYFWGLVEAEEKHCDVMAEIITNKILPHLKDILPLESLGEFFTNNNLGILYTSNDYGYDYADVSKLNNAEMINAFAKAIGSAYEVSDDSEDDLENCSYDEYDQYQYEMIKEKLLRYKNIIVSGCSGTGKSFFVNRMIEDDFFKDYEKMFWHSSTEYADVIEGVSAQVKDGSVEYNILPGMVRQLAERSDDGPKLMVIEGINKSNAAENFGELITLLEPDKRKLKVEGADGKISIPEDMYFLCTLNPTVENQFKLDSAMKRRFVIVDLQPDYKLLALHLGVDNEVRDFDECDFLQLNSNELKYLAIMILKKINEAISQCVGANYQVGHSVFWDLPDSCSLGDIIKVIDLIIIPQIEEYCYDEDIAKRVFGDASPVITVYSYGVEIHSLSSLTPDEVTSAIKEILANE